MSRAALPDKPSGLLQLALADLAEVEADPRYSVNMDRWHHPGSETCYVCLGGAVLAKSLELPPSRFPEWGDMGEELIRKMEFLNWIRTGQVKAALLRLGIEKPFGLPVVAAVYSYPHDAYRWRRSMEDLVALLRGAGL